MDDELQFERRMTPVILKKYIIKELTSRTELGRLHVDTNPRYQTDAIRIMRDDTEVMRISVDGPEIHFVRTVPRYEGDLRVVNAADPDVIDKIVAELYAVSPSNPDLPASSP